MLIVAVLVAACVKAPAARAQATLEKVRAQGFVRCAGVERPGLATFEARSGWSGLEVDVCRAVATAVLGASARFTFHAYNSAASFDSAREHGDQIAFLSAAEIIDEALADKLLPGPTIFVESHDLLVAQDSPIKHAADLARTPVCFIIATPSNDSLEAWFGARAIPLVRYPFREEDEMYDTYAVQRCKAVVGESTALAGARLGGGINHLRSRLLPEHLETFPILAATPVNADSRWAAIVAWVIATLRAAETPETYLRAGGRRGLPIEGKGLGLAPDWKEIMLARTGDYGAMFRRNLGAGSPLRMERGLN